MINKKPTKGMIKEWKRIWNEYKDKLAPNRKSGEELLAYLQNNYTLSEIYDKKALNAIVGNVTLNAVRAEKLPNGVRPIPKAFYLENVGKGKKYYLPKNRNNIDLLDGNGTKIFIGIDLTSGFYMVEGSIMLWDELCAFQGLDEKDLQNYFCVAQYINCLKESGKLGTIIRTL